MKNIYSQKAGAFIFFCSLFLFSFNGVAQVGINTTEPSTMLDVNGALSLREGSNVLDLGSGDGNDMDLGTTPYSFYRITGDNSDFDITGIIPEPNVDGQILMLINTRNAVMTIKNNSTSSLEANRIYVPGEKDFKLMGKYTTITLRYSKSLSRWVLLNKLNHIETWYDNKTINGKESKFFTTPIQQATRASSVSVNFSNVVPESSRDNLFIDYIESGNGVVGYTIRNTNNNQVNFDIVISINKI